ncbi:MAG: hypothetical protein ABL909_08070 [Sphingopyxis sp.]
MNGETGARESIGERARRWLARYGPAEAAAIIASYAGYFGVIESGGWPLLAAWVAAITENIGFYTIMIWRQLRAAPAGQRWQAMVRLGAEFGPAELVDSALMRPLAVAVGVAMLGPAWGVLAGKLAADAGFYLMAILMHEHLRARDRSAADPSG